MKKTKFLISISLCLLHSYTMGTLNSLSKNDSKDALRPSIANFNSKQQSQEGFLSGTKVKTAEGYKPIELLKKYDKVMGWDANGKHCERLIINIAKKQINQCIKISIGSESIYVAPDQKFYFPQEKTWVEARNLTTTQVLLTNNPLYFSADCIENINHEAEIYTITVDGHNLFVTPFDIVVHNADPITLTAVQIIIGYIAITNPITTLIGTTFALSGLSLKVYDTYKNNVLPENNSVKTSAKNISDQDQQKLNASLLEERNYYEKRIKELLKIKEEFVKIKKGLEGVDGLYYPSQTNFTYRVLQQSQHAQLNPFLQPSATDEIALDNQKKCDLLKLRESMLEHVENEIIDLQITLAFHFNELIERCVKAGDDLRAALPQINSKIALWNMDSGNASLYDAVSSYETILTFESLIEKNEYATNELKLAFQYYKNHCNNLVIKNTTNIPEILKQEAGLADKIQYIYTIKNELIDFKNRVENCLSQLQVSIGNLRDNIKGDINRQRSYNHNKELAAIEEKKSTYQYPKPPKKDDDKEKKKNVADHPHGKYKDAPYHHQNSSGQKSPAPKNGQKALDNSVQIKDTAPHRVGTSENEIVILRETQKGEFHGYTRSWSEILKDPSMAQVKNALLNSKLIDKFGNIV